ncbi:SET domain protein [Ancylostoma duodenale]|uniref:SET domain protein n=1 Tax=Ancylostoma duodenale TaxID=51022 RepID=A0A0C2D875_9BILA|nr:SET domain protein [Ancylostoma duodenale]
MDHDMVVLMGRDQIRMRSTGKVDVEKLAEATTVECGTTCSCTSECPSRFAERGRKIPLVVMYTTTKGWSVFAPQIIPAGTFLGVYTGEHQIPGTKQYVVDASRMGNETRYFNHACGDAANLKAVSLLSRGNLLTNNMLFFTKRTISKGEELTFSYRGKDMEEQKSGIRCLCTPGCQNRL